ncbi:MAG: LysR family transcriptional regulator [Polaromonas sp.]|nr:LysR family transcriptional regulator [Polaromonas sp.]
MKKTSASTISLSTALSYEPADKRIEILRLVGENGSISQAARDAKVSYKAAWQAIDTLTNLAGVVLVERAVGGSGGGGANITPAGEKLLAIARLLSDTRSQVFASFRTNELLLPNALPHALPVISSMSVRTSMRNQLPCRVQKLDVQGQVVRVYLQLVGSADSDLLVSRITKASAELLGLKKNHEVLALCKATSVQVGALQADLPKSNLQNLPGQALRISRGAAGDEVSLLLDSGLQLVGFAPAGSGLKAKARVNAVVEESAVVIALAG